MFMQGRGKDRTSGHYPQGSVDQWNVNVVTSQQFKMDYARQL